jgi:hypothetical protein
MDWKREEGRGDSLFAVEENEEHSEIFDGELP